MSSIFMFEIEQIRSVCGAKWLQKVEPPAKPPYVKAVAIDSRDDLTHKAFIAIKGAAHDGHDHLQQAVDNGSPLLIVEAARALSKTDPLRLPDDVAVMHVESTRKALGRIAHAHRLSLRGTKVIAVTGSAGKTTTKRLIHGVLSTTYPGSASPMSFNNDIGVPLTLLAAKSSDKYVVVEVGTNAPGEIADLAEIAAPDMAIITMIGRCHLEGLGSIEGIAREKSSLLAALPEDDGVAIVNADEPLLRAPLKRVKTKFLFGESDEADLRLTDRGSVADRWWFEVNGRTRFEIALPGGHNAINALAAVAVGRRFGLDDEAIRAGLLSVQPEAMRMTQHVSGGVRFFNDAYNANPESMIAALDTFVELTADAPRRIIVLGDMLELGAESAELHREIARHVAAIDERIGLAAVMLVGEQMKHAFDVLGPTIDRDRLMHVMTLDTRSMNRLSKVVMPGDAVLVKASRGMGLERVIERLEHTSQGRRSARRTVARSS